MQISIIGGQMIPSDDKIDQICAIVRMGLDFRTACLTHSIPSETITEWAECISKDDSAAIWQKFKQNLEYAEAQCRVLLLQRIIAEGGANGARYVLQHVVGIGPKNETKAVAKAELDPYRWMRE